MAILRLISVVTLLLASATYAKNFGSINIAGVDGPIYVVGPDWAQDFVQVNGNGFTLTGGGRVYFAKDPVDDFHDPYAYWQTPLIGNHFSYDIGNLNILLKHVKSQKLLLYLPLLIMIIFHNFI